MISLDDYKNPFDAILDFEDSLSKFTGAPYCVTTDCCTHAIEIAFRLRHGKTPVCFPAHTYLSVVMTMHKLDIPFTLTETNWRQKYQFEGSDIWDCARHLEKGMYEQGTIQCLSFGRSKPLEIGLGGCILTDDKVFYQRASRMRYDGRDIHAHSPWIKQKEFEIGYHYYLRPEECVTGINMLKNKKFTKQKDSLYNYPDCRKIKLVTIENKSR